MFTYLYNFKKYNFWKSGLLLDFYFKKFIYKNIYVYYYIFNILFGEKYIIENNFLKIIFFLNIIKNFSNFSIKYFSTFIVGFLLFFSFTIIYFTVSVSFT